jgi:hypothetical protein
MYVSARLQAERREAIVAAVAVRRLYRVQRRQLAAHTALCVRLPAPQEWLPVEALPELVAELDTPCAGSGRGLAADLELATDAPHA